MKSMSLVLAALLAYVAPATADLIGTQVSLSVGGGPPLSSVEISASPEFDLNLLGIVVTVDFTGNSLDLKYVLPATPVVPSLAFTFTDTAFAGLSIVETSDNFPSPGVTPGLIGNVLTLNAPTVTGPGTFDAVFSLTPAAVPVPAVGLPGMLLVLASGGLLAWRRRRQKIA